MIFTRQVFVLAFQLLLVSSIGYLALERNPHAMFWGGEGLMMLTFMRDQLTWMPVGIWNVISPTMGNGAPFLPFNVQLSPIFLIQKLLLGRIEPLATYLGLALEVFSSVFLLGRALRIGTASCVSAAWLILILMLPFVRPNYISYPVAHIMPLFGEMIAATCAAGAVFLWVGRFRFSINATLCVLGFCLLAWLMLSNAILFLLSVPALVFFGLAAFIGAENRTEILWKFLALLLVCMVLFAGDFPQYVKATYEYSALEFFGSEFVNNPNSNFYYVSVIFHKVPYSIVGPAMAVLGFLGGLIIALWPPRKEDRRIHLTLLLCAGGMIGGGCVLTQTTNYDGPKVLYLEFAFWPLYALWASWLILMPAARLCCLILVKLRWRGDSQRVEWFGTLIMSLAVAMLASIVIFKIAPEPENDGHRHQATAVTDFLASKIGLPVPGTPFRGRAATFTGFGGMPPGINWVNLDDVMASLAEFGNDHRFSGLWFFHIPVLFEDSTFTSPPMYAIESRLLARDGDKQMRNLMTFTRPDSNVLRLLGVRYVLTDDDELNIGPERVVLPWKSRNRRLRVLELENPNLGQYSPVEVVAIDDWSGVIERLKAGLDPERTVMVDQVLPSDGLSPATDVQVLMEKGYLHIHAKSAGRSLLVLPFEYSHCLNLQLEPGSSGARLFRADLINTGIEFQGTIDLRMILRIGPLGHSACRSVDVEDMHQLKMGPLAAH